MKKRIAIIIKSLSIGGAERVSLLLASWLKSQNFEVGIFTLNKETEKEYKLDSSINRVIINKSSYESKIKIIKNLRKEINNYKPSIILVMGVPLSIYAIPAIIGLDIPVVISERNDPSNFSGKKITKFISRLFMIYAKGIIFQTKEAMQFYPKRIQKKSAVIPNPIVIDNMPKPFKGERVKRIVSVGRLVPQKNHALLIKVFKKISDKYPEYTLNIYGEGNERIKLEKLINELNIDKKVTLPGSKNDIFNEILDAEIFVLSSDFEGLPNALIEAMALGLPVISTNCPSGGPAFLIDNMNNGILVNVGNEKEMFNAIETLILDKELSNSIGRKARNIINTLDKDKVCGEWLNFILKVSNDNKI